MVMENNCDGKETENSLHIVVLDRFSKNDNTFKSNLPSARDMTTGYTGK